MISDKLEFEVHEIHELSDDTHLKFKNKKTSPLQLEGRWKLLLETFMPQQPGKPTKNV